MGRGLSAVDAALLASVVVTPACRCGRAISAYVRPHVTWVCWRSLTEECALTRPWARVARGAWLGSLFGEVSEGRVAHHSMIVCHRDDG